MVYSSSFILLPGLMSFHGIQIQSIKNKPAEVKLNKYVDGRKMEHRHFQNQIQLLLFAE